MQRNETERQHRLLEAEHAKQSASVQRVQERCGRAAKYETTARQQVEVR
jgi:hypothetical protein